MLHEALDRWGRGWRGPFLAALVALIAGLPGIFALPTLDRDEARFAQASAQMLESGDYVAINFQDHPRDKKPVDRMKLAPRMAPASSPRPGPKKAAAPQAQAAAASIAPSSDGRR